MNAAWPRISNKKINGESTLRRGLPIANPWSWSQRPVRRERENHPLPRVPAAPLAPKGTASQRGSSRRASPAIAGSSRRYRFRCPSCRRLYGTCHLPSSNTVFRQASMVLARDIVAARIGDNRFVVHRFLGYALIPSIAPYFVPRINVLLRTDAGLHSDPPIPATSVYGRARLSIPWRTRLRCVTEWTLRCALGAKRRLLTTRAIGYQTVTLQSVTIGPLCYQFADLGATEAQRLHQRFHEVCTNPPWRPARTIKIESTCKYGHTQLTHEYDIQTDYGADPLRFSGPDFVLRYERQSDNALLQVDTGWDQNGLAPLKMRYGFCAPMTAYFAVA